MIELALFIAGFLVGTVFAQSEAQRELDRLHEFLERMEWDD